MCLIAFAVDAHPSLSLVVIANRDERYDRPTCLAHDWGGSGIFGGRDVEKGGTWLGVTRGGRFAAVTNVRSAAARRSGASRGALVRDALTRTEPADTWWRSLDRASYPSFNLLFGDGRQLFYGSEESPAPERITAGVHALSNARLDASWPKAEAAKSGLEALLAAERFDVEAAFALLASRAVAPDQDLPQTGVPFELERALSPAFIAMDGYGTRACTVVLFDRQGTIRFAERTHGPGGVELEAVETTRTPG